MNVSTTRVLVAEDDLLISDAIQDILAESGYTVVGEARNGQQAIELAQTLQPDVILMDLKMPEMDGLEATQQIQDRCPTPIVVLTAHETQELVAQASAAGVGAYLVKPPRRSDMKRAITIAMARFKDMMALRHLNTELQTRNKQLQEALAQVKQLSGLLPICGHCKNIRDDEGYWQDVAVYIRDHSEADFSHGICPSCMKELYPEFHEKPDESTQDILDALKKLGHWVTLENISAEMGMSESDILSSLQNVIAYGQVRQIELDGQSFYMLSG